MTHPDELDLEAPEADAAEQATPAEPDDDEQGGAGVGPVGLETPEWDAQEQSIPVPVDEDYR
jgi:hypothetical protein